MSKNVKGPPTLKPIQRLAINHLANGKSQTETAKLVGVSRQTIANWYDNPVFVSELNRAHLKRSQELGKAYTIAEPKALKFLETIIEDETADNSDRIRAAIAVIKESHNVKELVEFAERLSRLEEATKEEEPPGPHDIPPGGEVAIF